MHAPSRQLQHKLALALLLLLTALVYYPGLHGGFMFDDLGNITENKQLQLQALTWTDLSAAALSSETGSLKRPLSMLSFALNYYLTGDNPFFFKLTNLLIHLLNGCCVLILTRLLLRAMDSGADAAARRQWMSLAVAAVWLLHPINLTSVLYIVQRMNSLAALFTFCALIVYCRARLRLIEGRPAIAYLLTGVGAFGLLALFSKENSVLLPLYMLAIELTFFRFRTVNPRARTFLVGAYLATVALPLLAVLATLLFRPEQILANYEFRSFTWIERLLTEARALWYYLRLLILPSLSELGLYHDDFPVSRGLLQPGTTLPASVGLIALLGAGIASLRRQPVLAFGILWFLAGHLLESTIIPLELVFEHRNYLPGYGILFTLIFYLTRSHWHPSTQRIRVLGVALMIGLFAGMTAIRADQWSNLLSISMTEVAHHPRSARANHYVGTAYTAIMKANPVADFYQEAAGYYELAIANSEDDIASHVALIILSAETGRPVKQRWLDEVAFRLEQRTFTPGQRGSLRYLKTCQLERRCKLSNSSMINIFEGALRNKRINVKAKAIVYAMYAEYTAMRLIDPGKALTMLEKAEALDPDELQYKLDVASIYIAFKQYPDALAMLDAIQKIDLFNSHKKKILDLRTELQRRMAADTPDGSGSDSTSSTPTH